jgi:dTDP-4-dehydrorhamnose reductase
LKNFKNTILILGGDSNLGREIIKNFKKKKISFISTTRNKKKISKKKIFFDFDKYIDFQIPKSIKTVYFCASVTSIAICEKEKKKTREINVKKTCKLIEKFLKLRIHVIYFSTNLIFSGSNVPSFYFSKYSPQNEYALQKTMVEKYLINQKYKNYSIIRFGKIIFNNDELLLKWIYNIKKNLQINVANNKFISPIYYKQAIELIEEISNNNDFGIFQVSATDYISYIDIATLILNALKKKNNLIKVINLKKTHNAILVPNVASFKNISSKGVINKFLLKNKIV